MTEVTSGGNGADMQEMNRFADLFVARGLAALFLRELVQVRAPSQTELKEWQDFATAKMITGGELVGRPIAPALMDAAMKRAAETISVCFLETAG